MSDGKETVPSNPDNRRVRTPPRAKDQGVPISTVSFGTPHGYVEINDQRQPVPVDDEMLKKIAELSGGQAYTASSLEQLKEVFTNLQEQIGYETQQGRRQRKLAAAGRVRAGGGRAGGTADQPAAAQLRRFQECACALLAVMTDTLWPIPRAKPRVVVRPSSPGQCW